MGDTYTNAHLAATEPARDELWRGRDTHAYRILQTSVDYVWVRRLNQHPVRRLNRFSFFLHFDGRIT